MCSSFAIGIWLSAIVITIDGKPKQHLSQDVVPQAPIAKSAFKIKKAKLLL